MAAETQTHEKNEARRTLDPKDVQVGFYHLTRSSLEEALPTLLERTLDVGERAVVRCTNEAMVVRLDKALWACRAPIWLPHGTIATGYAARQPIWLTMNDDVPNGARFLFRIDGAGDDLLTPFTRVFDLFHDHDAEVVSQARTRWRSLQQAGYRLTYWKQEARGWQQPGKR